MSNDFCSLLSNGLYLTDKSQFTKKLSAKPCCYFKEDSETIERNKWNNITDWNWRCKNCQLKELNGKEKSLRLFANHLTPAVVNKITHLEIDYSNACNAACGICFSLASNRIAKIQREERVNNVDVPNVKRQEFIDKIKTLDLSELQYLKFRGGEPLYIDFHKEILSKVINPSNTTIHYQTNGSIFPDEECWNLLKKFKSVHFSFSIDAVGKKFEYIRAGLYWDEVDEVIKKIIVHNDNITAEIQCTYNPLNMYYHDELFKYFLELKKINKTFKFDWHPAWGTWEISNTTPVVREMINNKYNIIFSKILESNIFDQHKHQEFVKSLALHEKRFGFSGEHTFPEIWEFATKC